MSNQAGASDAQNQLDTYLAAVTHVEKQLLDTIKAAPGKVDPRWQAKAITSTQEARMFAVRAVTETSVEEYNLLALRNKT